VVRQAFAHDAVVIIEPDEDVRAIGGAVTTALCGHWEHEPPCPLAAHYTGTEVSGDAVTVHILFAADPTDEGEVRRRIEDALSRWELRGTRPGVVQPDELDHAQRLIDG
jgi:hypothetical protein